MKQNLKIRVNSHEESERAQRAFFALGFRWATGDVIPLYLDRKFLIARPIPIDEFAKPYEITRANNLMAYVEVKAKEISLRELETLAATHARESKMKPNGSEFAKVIGQLDITDEQATEQPNLTPEQIVVEVGLILKRSDETAIRAAFTHIFECVPSLARIIGQAYANFEGTKAVSPPSNATQAEYIDDYLDRLRGEETDFYK